MKTMKEGLYVGKVEMSNEGGRSQDETEVAFPGQVYVRPPQFQMSGHQLREGKMYAAEY